MTRCLILSCTQAKRGDERPLPALERYDGPAFRVVRRFLRQADPALRDVDVYVLSARYGLISANQRIADYDQRMTPARVAELRPEVLSRLREILSQGYAEVFLSLGRSYLQAVNGFEALVPDGTRAAVSRAADCTPNASRRSPRRSGMIPRPKSASTPGIGFPSRWCCRLAAGASGTRLTAALLCCWIGATTTTAGGDSWNRGRITSANRY
jgi:hypothetical protein